MEEPERPQRMESQSRTRLSDVTFRGDSPVRSTTTPLQGDSGWREELGAPEKLVEQVFR